MGKYFVLDEDCGYTSFDNLEDAITFANDLIQEAIDDGRWSDNVSDIKVCCVTHYVKEVNINKRPPENTIDSAGFDANGTFWGEDNLMCDYELTPLD